jgi:hypothetical protein
MKKGVIILFQIVLMLISSNVFAQANNETLSAKQIKKQNRITYNNTYKKWFAIKVQPYANTMSIILPKNWTMS